MTFAIVLAHAPEAFGQDVAAAEALFREGRALMDKGQYALACKKLGESQRLDASSGTLINLAACHEKEGKTATAWAEFLAAARLAKTQGRPDRAEEAGKQAAALEPKLSYLTIIVAKKLPGLEIRRGNVKLEASTLGSKLPTDPGEHEITISAPGHASMTMQIKIGSEADAQTLSVPALQPESASAAAPPTPNATPRAPTPAKPPNQDTPPQADASSNTVAYVIGGVGVAALGVGSVFGVMALSTYGKADDACPSHKGCDGAATDDRDKAGTQANIANVGIGLGIVGVGVSAVMLLTGGGDSSARGPSRPKRGANIRAGVAAGHLGFDLSGSF